MGSIPVAPARENKMGRKAKTIFGLLAMIFIIAFLVFLYFYPHKFSRKAVEETNDIKVESIVIEPTEVNDPGEDNPTPVKIDLQPVVDSWVNAAGGTKSILIYDLDRAETVGEYNKGQNFNTASLYKLFVVYEGYRRIQNGAWGREDRANYLGQTILDCLDLAIRESNSTCAEPLWAKIGHAELDAIIKSDFDIQSSNISGLSSNVGDIAKIMQKFYTHEEIVDEDLVARMKDSFLNQPITNGYEWRQGLPSGFSDSTKVYDKVGWAYNAGGRYWDYYHDAAIIETANNRHFIVVVMTSRVPYERISEFGTQIEAEIKKY